MNTIPLPAGSIPMQAIRLTVLSGPDAGKAATLEQSPIVIGRSASADFQLSDATVSENHMELSFCAPGIRFEDKQSRNGIRLNGVRVYSGLAPSGFVLMLGLTTLRVDLEGEYAATIEERPQFGDGVLVGTAPAMRAMYARLEKLAANDIPILLQGQSGTGKELIARAIHQNSKRRSGPYVVVDCARLTGALAASELFGHAKGAFTDAKQACTGMFERADKGTLFLDEVGDLPLDLQPLLLRAIQEGEIRPAGASSYRKVDVRLIAATWQDLPALVNQGRFRQDLFYRIQKGIVQVPSLADRKADIPVLVRRFLAEWSRDQGGAHDIADDALDILIKRRFPGNVRELRNTVELLSMLADGPVITAATFLNEHAFHNDADHIAEDEPATQSQESASTERLPTFKEAKEAALREFISQYLRRLLSNSRNLSHAASIAQLQRHTLRDLLRDYGLYQKK